MNDREIPKTLVKRGSGVKFSFSCYCPNCFEFLGYDDRMKYCKFCGQRVQKPKKDEQQ